MIVMKMHMHVVQILHLNLPMMMKIRYIIHRFWVRLRLRTAKRCMVMPLIRAMLQLGLETREDEDEVQHTQISADEAEDGEDVY